MNKIEESNTAQIRSFWRELGLKFFEKRSRRGIPLKTLSQQLKCKPREIENLELGKHRNIWKAIRFFRHFDRKIHIELEKIEENSFKRL